MPSSIDVRSMVEGMERICFRWDMFRAAFRHKYTDSEISEIKILNSN